MSELTSAELKQLIASELECLYKLRLKHGDKSREDEAMAFRAICLGGLERLFT